MIEEKIKINNSESVDVKTSSKEKEATENKKTVASVSSSSTATSIEKKNTNNPKQKKVFKRNKKGPRKNQKRSEFEQKVIDIRRVTRVVAGGRRFSFRVTIILGDMKGRVGVGTDKGSDIAIAIEKAVNQAKKKMIKINLTDTMSIPKSVQARFNASEVKLRPSPGRGIVAGSSVRSILQVAGVTDVVAKLLSRSGNKMNNARATIKALEELNK